MSRGHVTCRWVPALPVGNVLSARGSLLLVALLSLGTRFTSADGAGTVPASKDNLRDTSDPVGLMDIFRAGYGSKEIQPGTSSGFFTRRIDTKRHTSVGIKGSVRHLYGRDFRQSPARRVSAKHTEEGLSMLQDLREDTHRFRDDNEDMNGISKESGVATIAITSGGGNRNRQVQAFSSSKPKLEKYGRRGTTERKGKMVVGRYGETESVVSIKNTNDDNISSENINFYNDKNNNNSSISIATPTIPLKTRNNNYNDAKNYKNSYIYAISRTSLPARAAFPSRIHRKHVSHDERKFKQFSGKDRTHSGRKPRSRKIRFFIKMILSRRNSRLVPKNKQLPAKVLTFSAFRKGPYDTVGRLGKNPNLDIGNASRSTNFMQNIFSTSNKVERSVGHIPVIDTYKGKEGNIISFVNKLSNVLLNSRSNFSNSNMMIESTKMGGSNKYAFRDKRGRSKDHIDLMLKRRLRSKRHRKRLLSHLQRQQRSVARPNGPESITYNTDTENIREESVLYVDNLAALGTGRGVKKDTIEGSKEFGDHGDTDRTAGSQNGEESITRVFNRLPPDATEKERYRANKLESLANITRMMKTRRKCDTSKKSDAVRLMLSNEQVTPHFQTEVAKVVEVANQINNLLMLSPDRQLSRGIVLNQFFALAESVLEIGPRVLGCSIFFKLPGNDSKNSNSTNDTDNKNTNNINNIDEENKNKNDSEIGYIYPFAYYNESTFSDAANEGSKNDNNDKPQEKNLNTRTGPKTLVLTDLSREWDPRKMPFVKRHAERENPARLMLPTRVVLADLDASGDLGAEGNWSHVIRVSAADGAWESPYYECLFSRMVIQFSVPFYRVDTDGLPVFQ
ncbi:hypothetical protein EGW08_001156 [Elysia chlorotica]|uniref:Uncharacterized protein n=1 Tax=Elysia chlorotica TaxID=188477 RepID=A0A433UBC4_ELYCH|nr:hypothetical protein EGW08_001156 [Elysia chlorotica]